MNFRWRSLIAWSISALLALASVELAAQLAYRLGKGKWYWVERRSSARGMVQPHPYLGAAMVPNTSDERDGIRISVNSFRTRGPEFQRPKPPGKIRVVALGGSSTFGTGVSDDQTWEVYLNQRLGTNYEVINFSNPGGTTLEASIQTALLFSDVQPDIALYYMGWNDARVQHVKDLWPDWSDFHGKWVMSFGLSGRELREPLASGYLLKRAVFHYFFPRMDADVILKTVPGDADKLTDKIDPRAMSHYVRNLKNIIALCRTQGVKPVFIPQIMNWPILTNDTPYGWLPFVKDKDLKTVVGAYNQAMEQVAREQGAEFVSEVLEKKYGPGDFLDIGHFTPSGNQLFASALAEHFAAHKLGDAKTQASHVP